MNTRRRLTVAAAIGSVVVCVVTACSSGSTNGQGTLGNLSSPSTSPSVGSSAPVTGLPTVTPKGSHSSGHGSSSAPASSQPSGQPSGQPSPSLSHIIIVHPASDFAVTTTGACFWQLYNDGGNMLLQVGVEFKITYSGILNATSVAFHMTNSINVDNTTGTAPVGVFTWYTGTQLVNSSGLLGQSVKVTGTITGNDGNPSNNAASITVQMPTLAQIGGNTSGTASCS